jgi:tRNA-dihydrouridine synthase C
MLGRGALADPNLAARVAAELGLRPRPDEFAGSGADWVARLERLVEWTRGCEQVCPGRVVYRLKQWLSLAARYGRFAGFEAVKRTRDVEELFAALRDTA